MNNWSTYDINTFLEVWGLKLLHRDGFKYLTGKYPEDYLAENMCQVCRELDCVCSDYDMREDR